jgi:hypothetical protein
MISKYIFKIAKIFSVVVLFMSLFSGLGMAQSVDEEGSDSLGKQEFEVKLEAGTQSPINDTVPLKFYVKSSIDSKTAFIRWRGTHDIDFRGKEETLFVLTKGKEYVFTQNVKANKEGVYRITAEIEAWRSEANYVDSAQVNLQFDKKLELLPVSEAYKNGKVLWIFGRIGIFLVVVLLIFLISKFGLKQFKQWLARD